MARPKQHHYVTKAYLDGFLEPGEEQLVCYGRGYKSFLKSPDALGKQRNYYALRAKDGAWDDSLEKMIESTVEVPGLPTIKKLASGKTNLNWDERRALALLIAFQEMRTPSARAQLRLMSELMTNQIVKTKDTTELPREHTLFLGDGKGGGNPASIGDFIDGHNLYLDDHSMAIHQASIRAAFELQHFYTHMKFTVLYAPNGASFLTTDTLVIRVFHAKVDVGGGLDRPDVEVRFPLSRKAFLSVTHDFPRIRAIEKATGAKQKKLRKSLPGIRVRHIDKPEVFALNRGHARHAQRWVFSGTDMPWVDQILAGASMAPQITDLSSRNIMHMRTQVLYHPDLDLK